MTTVAHSIAWYFPESSGGTEVYLKTLVDHLKNDHDMSSIVVIPVHSTKQINTVFENIEVLKIPVSSNSSEKLDLSLFEECLQAKKVDIYHQHSWTTSCGPELLQSAKRLGYKTVLTIHVPGNICLRGTMMKFGKYPCDGKIDLFHCSICLMNDKGIPSAIAKPLYWSLPVFGIFAEKLPKRIRTLLAIKNIVAQRKEQLRSVDKVTDKIVAVCEWMSNSLKRNGIDEKKIVFSRQGVETSLVDKKLEIVEATPYLKKRLIVGYIGRWTPVKGVHVLVSAINSLSAQLDIQLVIYGMIHQKADEVYKDMVTSQINSSNIIVNDSVDRQQIKAVLKSFDVLAVPSQWFETGPLVVLEAQACGIPVVGSNIGGIAELVKHGEDGLLIDSANLHAWRQAFTDLVLKPFLLDDLRKGQRPPKSMKTTASEMNCLYSELMSQQ
ncbi:MAG: glycosyltransferase [Gammaproteobacteria bacterium]|nr:glycosyltransferase [Gammaproteobacteria bacterium]